MCPCPSRGRFRWVETGNECHMNGKPLPIFSAIVSPPHDLRKPGHGVTVRAIPSRSMTFLEVAINSKQDPAHSTPVESTANLARHGRLPLV